MEHMAKLYVGNSQNMAKVDDNSVDFIFTGPPYWNHLEYSKEEKQLGNINDYELFHLEIAKVWRECYRVLKPGAVLCIQANDLYEHDGEDIVRRIPLAQDFSLNITKEGFVPVNAIFWDSYLPVKGKRMPSEERKGARSHYLIPQRMQYFLFFIKKRDGKRQKENYDSMLTDYYWQPFWRIKTQRKLAGSIWLYKIARFIISYKAFERMMETPLLKKIAHSTISDLRKDTDYPATSERKIIQKILGDFTGANDLVLDPFSGAGTTLEVAHTMGRKCIGYEVNSEAADVIKHCLGEKIDIIQT